MSRYCKYVSNMVYIGYLEKECDLFKCNCSALLWPVENMNLLSLLRENIQTLRKTYKIDVNVLPNAQMPNVITSDNMCCHINHSPLKAPVVLP